MLSQEQAKELLFNETPVIFNGSEYTKITALIYRKHKKGVYASAEMLDKNMNCVVIAPIEWIEKSDKPKIQTPRTEELSDLIQVAKEKAGEFFDEIGTEKAKSAQEKLIVLIQKLLEIDSKLRVETNSAEAVRGLK